MNSPKFEIQNHDLGSSSDEFGWRSYHLDASGDLVIEFIKSATITAMDKDGAEIWTKPLQDLAPVGPNGILVFRAESEIRKTLKRKGIPE